MTHNVQSDHAAPVSDRAEFLVRRNVIAHVVGGLDSVLRIVGVLRSRRYHVLDFNVDICDGVVESRVACTLLITEHEIDPLLERMRRLPSVVSAETA